MTRAILGAAAFAFLFAAQAWLRPDTGGTGAPAVESSVSVLAGAVRPLFVAITWVQAEAALDDHRLLDALDRLRLLEAADPAGWEAALFRAHLIAHNLAEREQGAARADRIVEAVRILDAAAQRTRDPGPAVAKGQLMLESRMWDPDLSARLEQMLGQSPRACAVAAFEEAARRAPGSEKIRRLAMEASRLRAIELLMRGAPLDEALAFFERAGALAADVREEVLGRKLAWAWAALVRAAVRSDPETIAREQDRFLAVLSEWERAAPPSDDFEAVLAAALARRAVPLAEDRLQRGEAGASLSLIRLVHTIRSFVAHRLVRSHPTLIRDLADRRRVLGLLDEITRKTPELASRTSELRALVSAW